MKSILVKKGKKVVCIDMATEPSDGELSKVVLGRSGTLRAPVLQVGDTLLAGWDEDSFKELQQG
jgi:hypothetical protein